MLTTFIKIRLLDIQFNGEELIAVTYLNKRVSEARKRVEYLKKKRTALYLRTRRVDVQTWMLNNLVDDACRDLKEMRRLRNSQGTLCLYLLCRIDQTEIHLPMKSCSKQRVHA